MNCCLQTWPKKEKECVVRLCACSLPLALDDSHSDIGVARLEDMCDYLCCRTSISLSHRRGNLFLCPLVSRTKMSQGTEFNG